MSDNDAWERGEALEMAQDAADDLRAKLEEQSARIAGLEAECSNLERERSDALFVARETQADNERKADRIAELEADNTELKEALRVADTEVGGLKAERDAVRKALEKRIEFLRTLPFDNGTEDYQLSALEEADVIEEIALLAAAREGGVK